MKKLTKDPTADKNDMVPLTKGDERSVLCVIITCVFIAMFAYGVIYFVIDILKKLLCN
jgi:hypothetical protein